MTLPQFVAEPYFDPASESLRYLPEGPRILHNHPGGRMLLGWVAIQHGADVAEGSVNVLDLTSGRNRKFPMPGRPGFFVETDRPGTLLVGLEQRLAYLDLLTGAFEETGIQVDGDERAIINDGLAVEGGILFGTKDQELHEPVAALYYFDSARRSIHTVVPGQTCSNGKFLRRDVHGATLVDIDSIPKTISRYRLDSSLEQVLAQSLIVAPESLPGYPDGLRPSPGRGEGCEAESVIVAYYNPDAVTTGVAQELRLTDGAVLCEWRIPGSPRVTCPEFVEIDGKVKLLFTTAVEGMPASTRQLAPGAGSLYLAETPFDNMPDAPPLVPFFTPLSGCK